MPKINIIACGKAVRRKFSVGLFESKCFSTDYPIPFCIE